MITSPIQDRVLDPWMNQVRIDVLIYNAQNIDRENHYGEYSFSFVIEHQDRFRFLEKGEEARSEVVMASPHHDATAKYQDGQGMFYCSQLFLPKVNCEYQNPTELEGQRATIQGHFGDDKYGHIFFNCDYLDLYDPFNGTDEPQVDWDSLPDDDW